MLAMSHAGGGHPPPTLFRAELPVSPRGNKCPFFFSPPFETMCSKPLGAPRTHL